MKLKQLENLKKQSEQLRSDFIKEIAPFSYKQAELITGLSVQQIFRLVNNEKGQPKFETILNSYIKLKQYEKSKNS